MYIARSESDVALGRAADYEAFGEELHAIASRGAGYRGATLLQSYANPSKYTHISRWSDRDAVREVVRGEAFVTFAHSLLGSGVVRAAKPNEAYEAVFEADHPDGGDLGASTAERLVDFTLSSPFVAPEFEQGVRRLADVLVPHAQGILSVRLRRSLGVDTRYLMLVIAVDRVAARDWITAPQVRALMGQPTLMQHLVGSPSAEIHHVVKRYAS